MKGKKPTGRPSLYTPALGQEICALVAQGASVATASIGIADISTVWRWMAENEAFRDAYTRARALRADARFEAIDQVVDDMRSGAIDAQVARVQIDTIKWQAGKENAQRYGERTAVDLKADVTVGVMSLAETLEARRQKRLQSGGLVESVEGQREGGESSTTQ